MGVKKIKNPRLKVLSVKVNGPEEKLLNRLAKKRKVAVSTVLRNIAIEAAKEEFKK